MAVIGWTEIEAFYNIRKYTEANPEILNGKSQVTYMAKVKLHGTNAAVQCHADGRIIAQSRTSELVEGADNAGFAKWVKENETLWQDSHGNYGNARCDVIIYGEWIGPGVQKGVAVSEIPKKCFAVFAARPLANGVPLEDHLWVDPEILVDLIEGIPDTYVLPWYGDKLIVDWSLSSEEQALAEPVKRINRWVGWVEENDPWVEGIFNVKGTGEGLVFYPVSEEHLGYTSFNNLVFKAKGEKHKNIKTAAPAQVNPESAASIDQFVDMVLTEARLEQGARAVCDLIARDGSLVCDTSLVGKFIVWITTDVQKETQDELEASKLNWKQVQKPLTNKARQWYLEKAKR